MASSFGLQMGLLLLVGLVVFASPAYAFGAGNISSASGLDGYNWRHGDIVDVLLSLPISYKTKHPFSNLNVSRVYFGNWLRDYSQLVDAGTLGSVPEPLLRAIVSVLGFLEFGYATREFDVTAKRLGVYRPEEHIDNPLGYDSKGLNAKLRGPVEANETQIDETTGMKNYIANEKLGIATSSAYIRRQLIEAIRLGREGASDENSKNEAFIHLGAALHTLEDFAAHSNYVELALRLYGKHEPSSGLDSVFPFVGDAVTTPTLQGPAPPIVTGTFGPLDLYQSILGEIDDKTAARNLKELGLRLPVAVNIGAITASLKTVLAPLNFLSILPRSIIEQIDAVRSSSDQAKSSAADWAQLQEAPELLWNGIEPVFRLRDDIAKWIREHLTMPIVSDIAIKVSEILDQLVFAVLSIYMLPVLDTIRNILTIEKDRLTEKDKAARQGVTIFSAGSTVSDPTHSQLAKDHFDNVLNPPAGLVATVVTNLTTQAVVAAWDDTNISPEAVAENVLQALHHPYNASPGSAVQAQMFVVVRRWWESKSEPVQAEIRRLLRKETIEANDNHVQPERFRSGAAGPAEFEGSNPGIEKPPETLGQVLGNAVVAMNPVVVAAHTQVAVTHRVFKGFTGLVASASDPNPLDRALSEFTSMGGDVAKIMAGASISQIKAAADLGNLAKDVLIAQLPIETVSSAVSGLGGAVDSVASFFKAPFGW